jgi:mRNA interferase MazF
MGMVKRFEVYLVTLDPTHESEIKKTRPCVVVSPEEMHGLNTAIIAPLTTKTRSYPTRIHTLFNGKEGYVVLDQIRTVDKSRLVKFLGILERKTGIEMLKTLCEMFEY